jgi:hypothetical protein
MSPLNKKVVKEIFYVVLVVMGVLFLWVIAVMWNLKDFPG